MQQLALDIGLPATATLARFHAGDNAAVVQHLRDWLGQPAAPSACVDAASPTPAPIYLCGPSGVGKTYLLHAIHHAFSSAGCAVGWMDGSTWPAEFSPHWSAVLMDDVDLYDAERQAAAFNWFINATTPPWGPSRRILCAGSAPPAQLLHLREDLRTRLGWGHVMQLVPLNEAQSRQALLDEAAARSIPLGTDVVDYMLRHFSRDFSSLVQLLDMLDNYALRNQRTITIPLLRTMMQTE